jgi:8-oxo-dGTP pyrophosphatase MutT (NUDIX family)
VDEGVESQRPPEPRPAATIILLRDGDYGVETCLVRRNLEARLMPGVWVFPGGAVEEGDGADPDSETAHRRCAARELAEEAGVRVDPERLVPYSRWITPKVVPIRFDTRFYLASHPGDSEPEVDGEEVIDWGWFEPAGALSHHSTGEIELVFPTIKHLESLTGFSSVDDALSAAARTEVRAVEPTLEISADGKDARLGFDQGDLDQPGPHASEVDSKPPPGEA